QNFFTVSKLNYWILSVALKIYHHTNTTVDVFTVWAVFYSHNQGSPFQFQQFRRQNRTVQDLQMTLWANLYPLVTDLIIIYLSQLRFVEFIDVNIHGVKLRKVF